MEFKAGEHVFLKISPTKGVVRFSVRRKLSLKFICLFEILEQIGEVAYRLALPPSLEEVHDIFHVSRLKRYIRDESHVLDHTELKLQPDLSYAKQNPWPY